MSYSCLEELQLDLDLHTLNKIDILFNVGYKCNKGWFVVTDDGICHLFDKNCNLDNIKKIKQLEENHIRKDITKIVIPNSVTSIGNMVFYKCTGLTDLTIGNGVTSIGDLAFAGCHELSYVTIPNNVTSIRDMTFAGCHKLSCVIIPDSVTSIGNGVFKYCSGLMSVTIGNGVTSIGWGAFEGCSKLTGLIFKGKTLKQIKKIVDYPWGIKDESIIHVE